MSTQMLPLVSFVLMLIIKDAFCQEFSFEPIQYGPMCGLGLREGHGTWSVVGNVTLTDEDLAVDVPWVKIQTLHQICIIDLISCDPTPPKPDVDVCKCTNKSGDLYSFYVRQTAKKLQSLLMLQAVVDTRDIYDINITTANIGVLPLIHDDHDACHELDPTKPRPCGNTKNSSLPGEVVDTVLDDLEVLCDTVSNGGHWIIIQKRNSSDGDFSLGWDNYTKGFGDLHGNFWLGLENTYKLCEKTNCELRVDLQYNGTNYYAQYNNFTMSGADEDYRILVGGYSGDAGDSLSGHNGLSFSTPDRDNDYRVLGDDSNCAQYYQSGWWFGGCNHGSNLNGHWGSDVYYKGLVWQSLTGVNSSVTFSEMKIRPL